MSKKEMQVFEEVALKEKIFAIRGQQVMLDSDLAELYGVQTKVLNQAVKRNKERFPKNYYFQLTAIEKDELVTICDRLSNLKHSTYPPFAFTEHGVVMLASILRSKTASEISIKIVEVKIFTKSISKQLKLDIDKFEKEFFTIEIKVFKESHDRFIIIDDEVVYHFGASLKDLGRKLFAFSKFEIDALKVFTK